MPINLWKCPECGKEASYPDDKHTVTIETYCHNTNRLVHKKETSRADKC